MHNLHKCMQMLCSPAKAASEIPGESPGLPDGSRTKGRARWGDRGGGGGRGGQDHSSSSTSGVSSGVGVSPGFNRQPSHSPNPRLELVCSSPGAWNTNQLSTFELLLVGKETNNTKKPIPYPAEWSGVFHSSPGREVGRAAEPGWPCVLC